jgi:hypothetical protein
MPGFSERRNEGKKRDVTGRVNWESLAEQLGLIEDGTSGWTGERGSSKFARIAIEQVLGQDEMRAAVDFYVAGRRGSELARSVLWLLRPGSAMQRCREISTESTDPEERRTAVELLRVVADDRALPWISTYLDDEDEGVQTWGVGILDQLLFSGLIDEQAAEDLLRRAEDHANPRVRERAQEIREFLQARG